MSDIANQVPVLPLGEFRVGRVLSRSFEVLFHHFVKFVLVALLPYVLLFVVAVAVGVSIAYFGRQTPVSRVAIGIGVFIFVFVFAVLYTISMAVTLYGAFQDMRGRKFNLGEAFARGLSRFFPIIGVAICWMFAVSIGTLLLVIPGIIMAAAFYVALPVCVMEGLGPLQSMSRSAALTKGHRWKVYGIYFLTVAVTAILSLLINVVFGFAIGPTGRTIAGLVWNAMAMAFNSIAIAVMYHDLRVLKDGIDVDRIAAVFD